MTPDAPFLSPLLNEYVTRLKNATVTCDVCGRVTPLRQCRVEHDGLVCACGMDESGLVVR